MTEAIFFDMDGTLFQTDLILSSALEEVFIFYVVKVCGMGTPQLKNIEQSWAHH